MDEGNRKRGQKGFPQNREKNNCRLYTIGKLTENKGILSTNEEKGRNIPYLSTSYQQIVDNVSRDIHGTHRGICPQFFASFPQKIPLLMPIFSI